MKPLTYAERLARAYLKIGKRMTAQEAQIELDAAWQHHGLSAEYIVSTLERAKFPRAALAKARGE